MQAIKVDPGFQANWNARRDSEGESACEQCIMPHHDTARKSRLQLMREKK